MVMARDGAGGAVSRGFDGGWFEASTAGSCAGGAAAGGGLLDGADGRTCGRSCGAATGAVASPTASCDATGDAGLGGGALSSPIVAERGAAFGTSSATLDRSRSAPARMPRNTP